MKKVIASLLALGLVSSMAFAEDCKAKCEKEKDAKAKEECLKKCH